MNLRGKREVMCSCRCCVMINPKQKLLKKEHERDMRCEQWRRGRVV